jgi:hypothetical protein
MGREIRKVPANWEHPRDEYGKYRPMFKKYYEDVLNEWWELHKQWQDGTHPDILEKPERKSEYPFYAMWAGNPPDWESYQAKKYNEDELTHIQLYENTSEGTPISPVFKADEFEELCEWAAKNETTFADATATKEEWMEMLNNGLVYSKQGNITFI